jgi:hypothetical protein
MPRTAHGSVVAKHLFIFIAIFSLRLNLDYSRVDHSLRSACIGVMLAALCAGITAATSAANPRSTVAPVNSSGFHGATPKSWLAMRYPAPIAAGIPMPNPMPTCQKLPHTDSLANFVFFNAGRPQELVARAMQDRGVVIGRSFLPYTNWIRITIGRPEENRVAQ